MTRLGLAAFLFFGTMGAAQQAASPTTPPPSSTAEPKLPVVQEDACPVGSMQSIRPAWKIRRNDHLYSSYDDHRHVIGSLSPREVVSVVAAVNVILEPDKAVITHADPGLDAPLQAGDQILGYGFGGSGDWNYWAKGEWHKLYYESVLAKDSKCGFRDPKGCYARITENGIQEWWV